MDTPEVDYDRIDSISPGHRKDNTPVFLSALVTFRFKDRPGCIALTGDALLNATTEMTTAQKQNLVAKIMQASNPGYSWVKFDENGRLSHYSSQGFPETNLAPPRVSRDDVLEYIRHEIAQSSDQLKTAGEIITALTSAVSEAVKP